MSTYAVWKLWMGIPSQEISRAAASAEGKAFLDKMSRDEPYSLGEGLKIENIYMHGEAVGIGIELMELDWTTKIGPKNVFSDDRTKVVNCAIELKKLFSKFGLPADKMRLYHHIDLGG